MPELCGRAALASLSIIASLVSYLLRNALCRRDFGPEGSKPLAFPWFPMVSHGFNGL
jgi:hypothetical protein